MATPDGSLPEAQGALPQRWPALHLRHALAHSVAVAYSVTQGPVSPRETVGPHRVAPLRPSSHGRPECFSQRPSSCAQPLSVARRQEREGHFSWPLHTQPGLSCAAPPIVAPDALQRPRLPCEVASARLTPQVVLPVPLRASLELSVRP